MSDDEKIRKLESVAICSVNFKLPWYTIMKLEDRVIQDWTQSSAYTCQIDVINGDDVGSKIEYIPWYERYRLRIPLVHYFACVFGKDDIDNAPLLMLESRRVLDYILSDLDIVLKPSDGHELYRGWAFDIFDGIKEGLKHGEDNNDKEERQEANQV